MGGFLVGAVTSVAGQFAGGLTYGLFSETANQLIAGGVSGFAGGFAGGAANALMTDGNVLSSGLIGGGIGGVTGGLMGGLAELDRGNTFWGGTSSSIEGLTADIGFTVHSDGSTTFKDLPGEDRYVKFYNESGQQLSEYRMTGITVYPKSYNVVSAVNFINAKAYPKFVRGKCGNCAKAVRLAVEAGGIKIGIPAPTVSKYAASAKDYGPSLLKAGFTEIKIKDYTDTFGDIRVIQPYKGGGHGHMDMYNGKQWVSDFYQRGKWPGYGYRLHKPPFRIYRWNK